MSENNQLHDAPERQSELIAALRVEVATLEKDRAAIAQALDGFIEHGGHYRQAQRVEMLLSKYRASQVNVINYAKERNDARKRIAELEAQLAAVLATVEHAACEESDTTLICAGCGFTIVPDVLWGHD